MIIKKKLERNEQEYRKGLKKYENLKNEMIDNLFNIYNSSSFKPDIIIKYLQNKRLLNSLQLCPVSNDLMNLVNHKSSGDNIIWRCHKHSPRHDIKINIRSGSVFEGFLVKIHILYFLLFFCICENLTINDAFYKCNDFCQQIDEIGIGKETVSKFYRVVSNRIKERMQAD